MKGKGNTLAPTNNLQKHSIENRYNVSPRLGAFLHIFLDLQHFFTSVAYVCSGGALAFERGVPANRIINEIVLPKDSIISTWNYLEEIEGD